jgi:RNA polymerase sigma-70 factor (sigma-E family)
MTRLTVRGDVRPTTGRAAGHQGAESPAAVQFHAFVEAHHSELSRLAFLLSGDRDAADDLAADALLAAWRRWDRVAAADSSVAYVRGIVVNLAGSRVRRLVRERARLVLLRSDACSAVARVPDSAAVVDVQDALRRLPRGQRACVVLRHGLGLSEAETAQVLGVSVGTVKSQTSKGAAQLRRRIEG